MLINLLTKPASIRYIVSIILLLLSLLLFENALANSCNNPYKNKQLNQTEFNQIYTAHQNQKPKQPLNLCDTDLSGLNLSNLNLTGSNFSGANLSSSNLDNANFTDANLTSTYFSNASMKNINLLGANLTNANLQYTQLENADLRRSNLERANLDYATLEAANLISANLTHASLNNVNLQKTYAIWANFSYADLEDANLTDADFNNVQLQHSDLTNANLTNTSLRSANLSFAIIENTLLKNTDFTQANFYHTRFQPQLNKLPNLIAFSTIKNFKTIEFNITEGTPVLTELRTAYRKLGRRPLERQITSLLKVQEMKQTWQSGGWGYLEAGLNYVLFYLTSDYGAVPGRPIRLVLLLLLIYAIPYFLAFYFAKRPNGIRIYWDSNRFHRWNRARHEEVRQGMSILLKPRSTTSIKKKLYQYFQFAHLALFFSLLSAARIGWEDFNVSHWISFFQKRPFQLRAMGWVRMLAGSQSLISAYLIVIWALTYFGTPFQW